MEPEWMGTFQAHLRAPKRPDGEFARVRSAIGSAIEAWLRERGVGSTFHAGELRAHVAAVCGERAPASADRILRALRADGVVHYEVLSRRDSLYRLTWVCP